MLTDEENKTILSFLKNNPNENILYTIEKFEVKFDTAITKEDIYIK